MDYLTYGNHLHMTALERPAQFSRFTRTNLLMGTDAVSRRCQASLVIAAELFLIGDSVG